MTLVLSPNEVQLFGTRFPIVGPVQRTLVDLFAPKIDLGDSTNSEEVVLSTWTMRDWSGGLGIDHLTSQTQDQNRFSFGTLDTRFPRQLCLAPLVTNRGDLSGSVTKFIDYNNTLYAITGTDVYTWSEGSLVFSSVHTLGGAGIDAKVYKDILYITCSGSDIETYDSSTSTWGSLTGHEAAYLEVWNANLYALESNGTLNDYNPTDGYNDTGAKLDLPDGYATQLILFSDSNNEPALYIISKAGLWAYDSTTGQIVETAFTFPIHPNVGKACVWQGNLYIPVGVAVYRFDTQSVAPVGPDKDEGLPLDLSGAVNGLASAHSFFYAAVNASTPSDTPLDLIYVSWPDTTRFMSTSTSNAAILISDGSSWHVTYIPDSVGLSMGNIFVSNAESNYRLWFSVGDTTYSLDLPLAMFNPVKMTTPKFATDGYVITPWFDAYKPQMDKAAIDLELVMRNTSTTEFAQVYAQWDESEQWMYLGQADTDGLTTIRIDWDSGGKIFRKVRFKVFLYRGDTTSKSPILDSLTLTFQRKPDPIWSYQFTVDLSKQYKGKSSDQLRTLLEEAVASKTAGLFYYRYGDTSPITSAMVFATRGSGAEAGGLLPTKGRFAVVLIQIKAT